MEFHGTVISIENTTIQGIVEAQYISVRPSGLVEFRAGQYMLLADERFPLRADHSRLKWTAYSIASVPGEELKFMYAIRRTGGFTQHLAENLKAGDSLLLRGPYGTFVLDGNSKENIFVATGTGIAPIISMLRSLRAGARATLYYGFRTSEHFLFRKELEKLASNGLELIPTISRNDPAWKGERGHVQNLLKKAQFLPGQQNVYVCGNPAMVQEVRSFFLKKGFPQEAVKSEQW